MKRKLCVILACFLLSTGIMQVQADTLSDLKQKQEELEKQEKELKQQTQNTKNAISNANEEAAELEGSIEELSDAMDEIKTSIMEIMAEIELVEADIREKEEHIEQTKVEYAEAVQTREEQYHGMCIRIKYMYETGNENYLTLLLTAGSISEMLNKADYVEALYQYDRDMLEQYEDTVTRIAELESQLESELSELQQSEEYLAQAETELDAELAKLKTESDNYELQLAEVKVQAANYSAQLKKQQTELGTIQNNLKSTKEEIKKEELKKEEEAKRKAEQEKNNGQSQEGEDQDNGQDSSGGSSNGGGSGDLVASGGSELGRQIATYACSFIGNPYVAGGTSLTNGTDCSGFTQSVYAHFGYSIPRSSYSQRSCGKEVSLENAQPGDIVCYAGHVALYIGDGKIVHASTEKTGIKTGNVNYRTILSIRRVI